MVIQNVQKIAFVCMHTVTCTYHYYFGLKVVRQIKTPSHY